MDADEMTLELNQDLYNKEEEFLYSFIWTKKLIELLLALGPEKESGDSFFG
jgi:hypothetical protein